MSGLDEGNLLGGTLNPGLGFFALALDTQNPKPHAVLSIPYDLKIYDPGSLASFGGSHAASSTGG